MMYTGAHPTEVHLSIKLHKVYKGFMVGTVQAQTITVINNSQEPISVVKNHVNTNTYYSYGNIPMEVHWVLPRKAVEVTLDQEGNLIVYNCYGAPLRMITHDYD